MPACTPGTARAAFNVQENENTSELELQAAWPSPVPMVLRFLSSSAECNECLSQDAICSEIPKWTQFAFTHYGLLFVCRCCGLWTWCWTPLSLSRFCSLGEPERAGISTAHEWKSQTLWLIWAPDKNSALRASPSPGLLLWRCYRDGWRVPVPAALRSARHGRDAARVMDGRAAALLAG